ncbi:hypothetical protein OH77DRAFT_1493690 [Trametes cingulata]|nr:hypothetical protein OH77DRAFT_1493690 [Trametes cingulata]
MSPFASSPCPLVDEQDRVFAVLAGRPRDSQEWSDINEKAMEAFEEARATLKLTEKQTANRRGDYAAVSVGVSFGGGQTHPANFSLTGKKQAAVEKLLSNRAVCRLAGFGDSCMKLFAARLHAYYEETLAKLQQADGSLRRNFKDNVFAAATFNLGPQVVTVPHTDHMNIPAGWCAITALGRYDHTAGGHLLLWDLKLMVEFPPGALILIPSAILCHSNTAIAPHERRYSFTQYSAGGLFRWVECGCQTQKDFLSQGGAYRVAGEERWRRGVEMFSTLQELRANGC